MSRLAQLDRLVERGADRLQGLADQAAASDGPLKSLADDLAEDAAFLRRLKPTLIAARARGEAPTGQAPAAAQPPRPARRAKPRRPKSGGGPNPVVIIAAAFALGIFLAKLVDWRGHAHPRL